MTEDDEKTVVNNRLPELLEEMQRGDILIADPESFESAVATMKQGGVPDFTVTSSSIRTAWSREHTKGVIIQWGTKSAGFGELTLYQLDNGTLQLDTEDMGPDFCKSVLLHLFKSAWASQFGVDVEGPTLTDDATVLRKGVRQKIRDIIGNPKTWVSPEIAEAEVTVLLRVLYPEKYDSAYEDFRKERTPKDITSPLHEVASDSKDLRTLLAFLWALVEGEVSRQRV